MEMAKFRLRMAHFLLAVSSGVTKAAESAVFGSVIRHFPFPLSPCRCWSFVIAHFYLLLASGRK